ncbi:PEP-CTERM -sorting domain protein [Lyngbya aestuarii BL J]|uniref:PEP-CTERM-sorting domain protein n=1 Tax=Lyngbya aestuarii BL J TaxID=1348334 RepID=U7QMT0_9CYAN|nr:ScyD/ScyE family protein [Lyngbya aestuarii]ERT08582.1 PEP-CTERM -sorting domain protein [Lyngbya aestuarii BL J]
MDRSLDGYQRHFLFSSDRLQATTIYFTGTMKLKQIGYTLLTITTVFASATPAKAANFTTVASGLNNPSGITFGPDGSLYVGETGTGGDGNCQPSPSAAFANICAGQTGSLTKVDLISGTQTRVIDNFDSLALQPTLEQGAGPQEIAFDFLGNAYLVSGYAGYPGNRDLGLFELSQDASLPPEQDFIAPPTEDPNDLLNVSNLGKLFKVDLATQEFTELFDFAQYEQLNNLDGGDYISNPFAIAIQEDSAFVVDAGANVIYNIGLADGELRNAFAAPTQLVENVEFPPASPFEPPQNSGEDNPVLGGDPSQLPPEGEEPEQPSFEIPEGPLDLQSVPTGITIGPDGAAYYAELTGYPYPEGEARVLRINPETGEPEVFAEGFTQITDLTFDADGNLLVLQFADEAQWKNSVEGSLKDLPGSVVKVTPDGKRTTIAQEGIFSATGIQVGPDGGIYVANNGIGTNGSVIRFDDVESVPEPGTILGLLFFGGASIFGLKGKRDGLKKAD